MTLQSNASRSTRVRLSSALLLAAALVSPSCSSWCDGWTITNSTPDPIQRGGSSFAGSAHWAFDRAQPHIVAFSNGTGDNKLLHIIGAYVYEDGRLPANRGTWSIALRSPSQQKLLTVKVLHDGTTETEIKEHTNDDVGSVHSGFVNSTDVFTAIAPHRTGSSKLAAAVLQGDVWSVHFGDEGHSTKWDGQYVE